MLKLVLLGEPQIELNGKRVIEMRKKARALLFFLAFSHHSHSRESLGQLLWPESEEGRKLLRGELNQLKEFLGESFSSIIFRKNDYLQINLQASDVFIDIHTFENNLRAYKLSLQQLEATVALYQGSFLAGFTINGLDSFNEAVSARRKQLADKVFNAIRCLAVYHAQEHQYGISLDYADKLINIYPLSQSEPIDDENLRQQDLYEMANCLKMVVLAISNQWEQALYQYNLYEEQLHLLFGSEAAPSLAAIDLRRQLRQRGEIQSLLKAYLPDRPLLPDPPLKPPFQVQKMRSKLVGRGKLIAALYKKLQHDPGLYSLVGMGGVGKSSLARQLAHLLKKEYADGILWEDMAAREPISILKSWAKSFNTDFSTITDVETCAAEFCALTADKHILIILDNVTKVHSVELLLPNSPYASVLTTTRDLDVANALNSQIINLGTLLRDESFRLFTRLIGPERIAGNEEAVKKILKLLGDLPLAIEIAGQRLRSRPIMPLAEYAATLETNYQNRLSLNISDREVRAAFQQSWDYLKDPQEGGDRKQEIFAFLGIFEQRPFTATALAQIAEIDIHQANHYLADFCALSLAMEYDAHHYHLHPLLADFALDKLTTMFKADDAYQRMTEYYLRFALQFADDPVALEEEWSQLTNGLEISYKRHNWPIVLNYTRALEPVWFLFGRFLEALNGFDRMCEAAEKLNDQSNLAWGLCQRGRVYVEQNNCEYARAPLLKSLEIYNESKDKTGIAKAKYYLGRIAVIEENYVEAELLLGETISLCDELNDQIGIADALYILEDIPYYASNFEVALWFAESALNLYKDSANAIGIIRCYGQLAIIAFKKERFLDAENYCLNALSICDELHEQAERAIILYDLADAYLRQNKLDLALKSNEESLYLLQNMNDKLSEARVLRVQADIYIAMKQDELALPYSQQSLKLFQQLGDTKNIRRTELQLNGILSRLKRL